MLLLVFVLLVLMENTRTLLVHLSVFYVVPIYHFHRFHQRHLRQRVCVSATLDMEAVHVPYAQVGSTRISSGHPHASVAEMLLLLQLEAPITLIASVGWGHLRKLYRAKQCVRCVMLAITRLCQGALNVMPVESPSEKEVQEASTVREKGALLAHYASPGST